MEGESVIDYQFSIIGDELLVMVYRLSVTRHFCIRHPTSCIHFFQPLAVMVYRILVIGILYQASGILHPFLSTVNCHQLLLNFLSSPGQ